MRIFQKLLIYLTVPILAAALISGCGGTKSKSSPTLYAKPKTENKSSSDKEKSAGQEQINKKTVVVPRGDSRQASSAKSQTAADTTASDKLSASAKLRSHQQQPPAVPYQEFDPADSEDLASAVDDDIWRQLDLADEYHALGVIANREGSWEEAQYYFEKGFKILATLDIEADQQPSPEATKYTQILNNTVADYRVALRSLGRLEEHVSASVLVERFGDLGANLKDTIAVYSTTTQRVKYDIPVVFNDRVRRSIVYFQTVAHDAFVKYLRRSKKYTPMMKRILREHGLPDDLIYLSLVESGYNPNAYSWARAMGLWQFISSTGRMYGLKRSWWIDERKDPIKSTHAACVFLKELYTKYGSWELAMAAYNGGPGRVSRTIKKQKTRDFWKLRLRRQTMDYVPLIMAATIIAKNPQKYGFYVNDFEAEVVWEEVKIDRCLDLKTVANGVGCSLSEMKMLNPELLRNYTPPSAKHYTLKIPVGKSAKFWKAYPTMKSPKETSWVRHKIRRGETVSTIASRYGVSQYAILEANNLRSSRIYSGKTLIVPVPLDRSYRSSRKRSYAEYSANNSIYVVRSGDTMWDIARAFGTTVSALRRSNSIGRGSRIYVGQKLRIPSNATKLRNKSSASSQPQIAAKGRSTASKKTASYKVRRGDTLWDIARNHGTTTATIRALNGLGRSSRIYPGQILEIRGSSDYISHRIKRGETLSTIARKYSTSIAKIMAHNNIDNPNQISVGYRLRIYTR